MARRRAVTLIELLVVVGVIAVLAAMLLPAIALVRRSAALAVCSSQMRQISLALTDYLPANEGGYPWVSTATWFTAVGWQPAVADRLGNLWDAQYRNVYFCPRHQESGLDRLAPSYVMNTRLAGQPPALAASSSEAILLFCRAHYVQSPRRIPLLFVDGHVATELMPTVDWTALRMRGF